MVYTLEKYPSCHLTAWLSCPSHLQRTCWQWIQSVPQTYRCQRVYVCVIGLFSRCKTPTSIPPCPSLCLQLWHHECRSKSPNRDFWWTHSFQRNPSLAQSPVQIPTSGNATFSWSSLLFFFKACLPVPPPSPLPYVQVFFFALQGPHMWEKQPEDSWVDYVCSKVLLLLGIRS